MTGFIEPYSRHFDNHDADTGTTNDVSYLSDIALLITNYILYHQPRVINENCYKYSLLPQSAMNITYLLYLDSIMIP